MMNTRLMAYIHERREDLNKQLDITVATRTGQNRAAFLNGKLVAYSEMYQKAINGEV